MITAFRRYLETWYVRAFFAIMVAAFIFWGVGDVVRMIGSATWVVKVAGQTIEGPAFQAEFQRAMTQASRNLPPGQEPTPEMKRQVGEATLQRVVGQAAMAATLRDMRIVTPDDTLSEYVRAMPAFRGPDGKFSRPQFESVLRNNGLTEPGFLQAVRADISERQLLGAMTSGAAVPNAEADPLYETLFEKRSADTVEFLFANAPPVAQADDATLRRWYENHPESYATPEYRRVKAVVLAAQTLANEIKITDADLHAAYDRAKDTFNTPAKRSAEVVSVAELAKAQALLATWQAAAKQPGDWDAIQAAAKKDDAAAIAMDDATQAQFPDPELAKAVFAADKDVVTGPVKGALGYYVLKVTAATAGTEKTFDEEKDAMRQRVLADKATDIIYTRANSIDNLLGNGSSLDDLPGDLGLAAVTGTMDSEGDTPDGKAAPIPGPPELRKALIEAAFQARPGDPPRLTEAQTPLGSAYFALVVDSITPPGTKPFDTVRARVVEDWTFDQQRHAQEQAATTMLTALQGGQSFADAATVAGVAPRLTPLVTRSQTSAGMPPELQRVLFGLKKDEPTMVEVPEGFVVAEPVEIVISQPNADAVGFAKTRSDLNHSIANDIASVFVDAVRRRAKPNVDQANFNQIVQP